jgi:hypothetical protein
MISEHCARVVEFIAHTIPDPQQNSSLMYVKQARCVLYSDLDEKRHKTSTLRIPIWHWENKHGMWPRTYECACAHRTPSSHARKTFTEQTRCVFQSETERTNTVCDEGHMNARVPIAHQAVMQERHSQNKHFVCSNLILRERCVFQSDIERANTLCVPIW